MGFTRYLSLYYEEEVARWLRRAPGGFTTSFFHVYTLFGAAYQQAATMNTAVNVFKASGIRCSLSHFIATSNRSPKILCTGKPHFRVPTLDSVTETDPKTAAFPCISPKDASPFPQPAKDEK
ncbi:hypothetical protein PR048_003077 [Dryococelus australis]|uniref:Uncharacterized protein n=1 Tax=Dryococelus australis TaxID=614101 RepID=A0ABQ9IML0_9NEOP|nr:hypothetical protein PR048_003077 [Dryococelus australis]